MKKETKSNINDEEELVALSLDEENVVRTRSRSSMAKDFAKNNEEDLDLMVIASPVKRAIAFIFDLVFVVGIYLFSYYLSKLNYSILQWWMGKYRLEFWFSDAIVVKSVFYLTLFVLIFLGIVLPVAFFNNSFGKKILHLNVRGDDQYSVTIKTAFYREIILKPISIISLIGFIMPFFNKKRKSLHDYFLKTLVVNS